MYKNIVAVILAAGLISAPGPILIQSVSAQTTAAAKTKKPSTAQVALRERQKKCGEEWKAEKKAGKIEKGTKWPQFWSACNKRLKAGG